MAVVVLLCGGLAAGLAPLLQRMVRSVSALGRPPSSDRTTKAAVFLLCLGGAVLAQGVLYDHSRSILWRDYLVPFPPWLAQTIVAVVGLTGAAIVLAGRRAALGRWSQALPTLLPFFCCGGIGFVFIYALSGGYVRTGYLERLCPFVVFFTDGLLALGLCASVAFCGQLFRAFAGSKRGNFLGALTCAVTSLSVAAMAMIWVFVQAQYVRLQPPDKLAFLPLLKEPAFKGVGLVTNAYAAPFGYVSGTWAYGFLDFNDLLLPPTEALAKIPYMWLADRHEKNYLRPSLYVCFQTYPTFTELFRKLAKPDEVRSCGLAKLDKVFARARQMGLKTQILAHDSAGDEWAIVRLTWPAVLQE